MAAKEAIVVVIDVGKTMSDGEKPPVKDAIGAVRSLIQSTILFSKNTELCIVLFGTQDTQNELEDRGYDHVYQIAELQKPSIDFVKEVESIEGGHEQADMVDGMIVAMDLLISRSTSKMKRRIILITDGKSETNVDGVDVVFTRLAEFEIHLDVLGVGLVDRDGKLIETGNDIVRSNVALLNRLISDAGARVKPLGRAIEALTQLRTRTVLQRTTFRGPLEISEDLQIPLWSFVQVMEQKFPTLKKRSVVAEQSVEAGSYGVRLERSYASVLDPDAELEKEQLVRGYKYGRTLIPFSTADEAVLKYAAPKCLKLIGFTKASNVPRAHYMGNAELLVPQPGDQAAATAVSALAHAMYETERYAIVRFVKRMNSTPHLGALLPYIKPNYCGFHFIKLPFSDDVRDYPFASLDVQKMKGSKRPNAEQLLAAENLINGLDLMTGTEDGGIEMLHPKYTFNPVLQHFYQCLHYRAANPDKPLPALDPVVESYVKPDQALFDEARPFLEHFRETFPLEKVESATSGKKRMFSVEGDAGEVKLTSYEPAEKRPRLSEDEKKDEKISLDDLVQQQTSSVGTRDPVQDFTRMLARKDIDLVDTAIREMAQCIRSLLRDSLHDQLFEKTVECVVALREGCVKESEPAEFNTLLQELQRDTTKKGESFWEVLRGMGITLISSDECTDSIVSPEEAQQFLEGMVDVKEEEEEEEEEEAKAAMSDTEDADDLLSMF